MSKVTLSAATDGELQWGRGLSTAEMLYCFAACRLALMLQWGRGLSTAEIRAAAAQLAEVTELQWGRGLSTAEIWNISRRSTRR